MFKFLVQTAALLNFALLAVNYRKIERIHTVTFIVVYSPISVFYTSQFVPQIYIFYISSFALYIVVFVMQYSRIWNGLSYRQICNNNALNANQLR